MTQLLSPGGTVAMAVRALDAGADAVYVGPHGWSRRWENAEIQDGEIREVHEHAVAQGKSVTLCFNCHCASREVPLMLEKIEGYVGWGIENFTLLDYGIIALVRARFPHVKIRGSLATTIINMDDVAFLKEAGVDNVVLRPDCYSPEEMRMVREQYGLEVEVITCGNRDFAHTGRCVMSPYTQKGSKKNAEGREMHPGSPNRGGLCHRICLSEWHVTERGESVFCGKLPNLHYVFLENIERFLDVPVDWFKLQGRVYSAGHIEKLTRFFRALLDASESLSRDEFTQWKADNKPALDAIFDERDRERVAQTSVRLELEAGAIGVP
jgi:putative protease